jgi:hypothetical protein
MAMLVITRGYIHFTSQFYQPASGVSSLMHPPLAAFVAFAFDWLSSGDVALGKGSMGRYL